ncbi:hypothetical protein B0T18DRAFT_457819 [Schizothecium vesticola]|uniref:DUF8212 domain-containing protein n=1 Tax=Schizothecium vesticola TaxID=314040 RepID=A0AA40F660_9PEZI|nr:hypothetical protein B0T18DRAFT_457819 [Schizothecium vesticola]
MFAWYRDSAVCYIYLSDVDVSEEEHHRNKGRRTVAPEDSLFQTSGEHRLLRQVVSSQWFTRGWTLQELLAPAICIFYDLGWVPLLKVVKQTARTESDRYGVGRKPRWLLEDEDDVQEAIGRTTRAEDMAYCLMGIFNVNMPLMYGEGGVKAFRRLQEEIIKQTDDHSIFYWRDADADRSAFRGLLARSPADFSNSNLAGFSDEPEYTRAHRDGHPTSTHDKTFGMTNRGLRISLAIISSGRGWEERVIRGDDEVAAILECGIRRYYIILARLNDDEHYARVDAHLLPRFVSISSCSHSQSFVGDIFVRQEPVVHHCYMSSRMTAVEIGSDPAFEIISTCPEEAWDADARQIKPMDSYISRGTPSGFRNLRSAMWRSPSAFNHWLKKHYFSIKEPLATAVVHVANLFPPGVPSIDFTISVRWKSRTEGDEEPRKITVQFEQVHYTGMATQTGWKVSPRSIVWTSSSEILRIGVLEQTLLDEGGLVLGVCFTCERNLVISGKVPVARL